MSTPPTVATVRASRMMNRYPSPITFSALKSQISRNLRLLNHASREPFRWKLHPGVLDARHDARADAGGDESTRRVTILVHARLLEHEQLVHLDLVALHASHFADRYD